MIADRFANRDLRRVLEDPEREDILSVSFEPWRLVRFPVFNIRSVGYLLQFMVLGMAVVVGSIRWYRTY